MGLILEGAQPLLPSGGTVASTDITDSTAAGRTLLTAASLDAARASLDAAAASDVLSLAHAAAQAGFTALGEEVANFLQLTDLSDTTVFSGGLTYGAFPAQTLTGVDPQDIGSPPGTRIAIMFTDADEEFGGIFVVTVRGNGATSPVLTRAADFNSDAAFVTDKAWLTNYQGFLALDVSGGTTLDVSPVAFTVVRAVMVGETSALGLQLIGAANAGAARTSLGLTSLASLAIGTAGQRARVNAGATAGEWADPDLVCTVAELATTYAPSAVLRGVYAYTTDAGVTYVCRRTAASTYAWALLGAGATAAAARTAIGAASSATTVAGAALSGDVSAATLRTGLACGLASSGAYSARPATPEVGDTYYVTTYPGTGTLFRCVVAGAWVDARTLGTDLVPINFTTSTGWTLNTPASCTSAIASNQWTGTIAQGATGTPWAAWSVNFNPASFEVQGRIATLTGDRTFDRAEITIYTGGVYWQISAVRDTELAQLSSDLVAIGTIQTTISGIAAGQGWIRLRVVGGVATLFAGIGSAGAEPTTWTTVGAIYQTAAKGTLGTLRFGAQKNVDAGGSLATTVTWDSIRVREIL